MNYKQLYLLLLLLITASAIMAQAPILWGTTEAGGRQGYGTIFSYNSPPDTEKVQYNFDSITGSGPLSALFKASDGLLYGTTNVDGINDTTYTTGFGIFFSYNMSNGTYTVLHYFGSSDTDGRWPYGAVIQASAGGRLLYGMALGGGANGGGVIFSYNISTGDYAQVYSFGTDSDGNGPTGSFIQAGNGLLYGTTLGGGTFGQGGYGTIFSYDVLTGAEQVLYSFASDTTGYPGNSLIQASDSLLYGMTEQTIFSYNITADTLTVVHHFGHGNEGGAAEGALIQASNGLLYGMTTAGGTGDTAAGHDGGGIIFSYDIASGTYTILHDFSGGDSDGAYPLGSLLQASDSLLYGMADIGGASNAGIIFSYNISSDTFALLHSFGNGNDGGFPVGTLIQVGEFTTGINKVQADDNSLQIFPNPSPGQFTIQLPPGQSSYPVEIYNVLGEKIYESVLSSGSNTIDLSSRAAGMYIIYLHMKEVVETSKVVMTK